MCKSCRTCFKFYCMFYFPCDRSLTPWRRCSYAFHIPDAVCSTRSFSAIGFRRRKSAETGTATGQWSPTLQVGDGFLWQRESPALASTPPGMPGTHPLQYFGRGGDVNGNIPNINFKFSTSEFTKVCHFGITKQKNLGEGALSPSQTPHLVGKGCWWGTPNPHLTPFGASSPRPQP